MRLRLRVLVLLVTMAFAAVLTGCVAGAPEPLTLDQMSTMGMSNGQKLTDMPEGFPAQVPVISGEVLLASSYDQGDGVWLYDLRTEHVSASAAEWYRRMYPIANWELLSDTPAPGGQVVTMEFAKGDARSTVVVRDEAEGTLVEVSVALNAPASDTF